MTYNSYSHINGIEAVTDFFGFIVKELKVNFHPDESFDQYIHLTTKEKTFSPVDCALYDRLMKKLLRFATRSMTV